jgi:hypothetical protein
LSVPGVFLEGGWEGDFLEEAGGVMGEEYSYE